MDGVGDERGFDSGSDLVDSYDGRAVEDCGYEGGEAGCFSRLDWRGVALIEEREGLAEEGLAAEAGKQRAAEREQFLLAGEEGEVIGSALAKAIAWVKDDGFGVDAGS